MSEIIDTNTLDFYVNNADYEILTKLPVNTKSYKNKIHGKLTAKMPYIKIGDKSNTVKWLCECECGQWAMLTETQFKGMKSCGCEYEDKVLGKRHEHIKCIEKIIKEENNKKYLYYKVKCDCGKEVIRPLNWILGSLCCGPDCRYYNKN